MMGIYRRTIGLIFLAVSAVCPLLSQISPGELSKAHSAYEGISNCTQCHVLGNKVSVDKCLACHSEIGDRIKSQKGYHSSSEVKGKLCFSCHSEHNGINFRLIRLDVTRFDHNLTEYPLSLPHSMRECRDCHKPSNISDPKLKVKTNTYLGAGTSCLTCHEDYHRQTLSSQCLTCHNPDAFKPATKFNHTSAKFQLNGKHKTVDCIKCHKIVTVNGMKFQEFRGLQFGNCTGCHNDPHKNKFGQNCRQCHTEQSFTVVKNTPGFDHSKTSFPLVEKHLLVDCKACHKGKLTDPVRHFRCDDCHSDYHDGQFLKNGLTPDCSQCHSVAGFTRFSFSVEQHNAGPFPLRYSHQAVPCTDCHKKLDRWSFRNIGLSCKECHNDIHQGRIEPRYYPDGKCNVCHNENRWADINFNHSATKFPLTGQHMKQSCRACHFRPDKSGIIQQKFYELTTTCTTCHNDNHNRQFEKNGLTDCLECHDTENWSASKFNHDNTAFKLDGKHINVPCAKCHKPQQEGNLVYVKYKLKEFKCESCHY
ncbi:MAG: cytochrome c3 family protein [Bacteroidota bacterium]